MDKANLAVSMLFFLLQSQLGWKIKETVLDIYLKFNTNSHITTWQYGKRDYLNFAFIFFPHL